MVLPATCACPQHRFLRALFARDAPGLGVRAPRCGVRARLRDAAAMPDVLVSCARSEARPFARNPRATINRLLRLSMWLAGHHSPCGPDM